MVDTKGVNLLTLVSERVELKRTASTNGGEHHGACPFCGGKDRFAVQPNAKNGGRWMCRNCTPKWQDAIQYVIRRDGCTFKQALDLLGLKGTAQSERPRRSLIDRFRGQRVTTLPEAKEDYTCLTDESWQMGAESFCGGCFDNLLWADRNHIAWEYLYWRGISEAVVMSHSIGYNPSDVWLTWGDTQVWLPEGIVIPWEFEEKFWNISVRPFEARDGQKYFHPKGYATSLYYGVPYTRSPINSGSVVMLTEGEFDAMAFRTCTQFNAGVKFLGTGSATAARSMRWVMELNSAALVALAFDADKAGDDASNWWASQLGSKAVRARPVEHDITDMVQAGVNLHEWLEYCGVRLGHYLLHPEETEINEWQLEKAG